MGRVTLLERGWVTLPALLAPDESARLTRHYLALIEAGQGQYDQPELTHRWWIQDDPAGRELLLRLTAVVAPLVGRPIKPSYCFACRYFDEAKLPCHVDREQCEYSITLLLAGPSSWPLTLHAPEGPVDIHQRPGDALAYLGRRLPHERPPLPPGATSLHLFLHWVDEGFVGWLG